MVKFASQQSIRRLFVLFFIIAFLFVSLLYVLGVRPQASEIGTALESRSGSLRSAGDVAPNYFYLNTTTGDVLVTGITTDVTNQLKSYVNTGELTVQGELHPAQQVTRRPSVILPQPIFVVSAITPPTTASVPCSIADGKIDVIYLVDASGTMDDKPDGLRGVTFDDKDRPDHLVEAVTAAMKGKLRSGSDRLALGTFSNPSKIANPFNESLETITTAVTAIRYSADGSNIGQGVQTVSEYIQGNRRDVSTPVVVVILTDNQSKADAAAIQLARDDHDQRNVTYYGVATSGDNGNLRSLVEAGGGTYASITDHNKAEDVAGQISTAIDSVYANCISMQLQSNKPRIRSKGGEVDLIYQYKNNSRHDITEATITHTLPQDLETTQGKGTVSIFVGTLKPGETGTKQVTVKAVE